MATAEPVWWLSWFDSPKAPPGKDPLAEDRPKMMVWTTGWTDEGPIYCARVVAPDEVQAWKLIHVPFPQARKRFRFSEQRDPGWWPPGDRFPRPAMETTDGN